MPRLRVAFGSACALALALTVCAAPAAAAPSDTVAPTVANLTVVPGQVDAGYQDVTATVVVRIVDTSGSTAAPSGFASGTITFAGGGGGGGGTTLAQGWVTADQRVAGTAIDGTYDLAVAVPQGTPAGSYLPTVTLTDGANRTATTTVSASPLAVVDTADTQSPTMSGALSLTPTSLDTTSADQTTHLAVRLIDAQSGVGDATVTLTGPGGVTDAVPLTLATGTAQDGMWTADAPFTHDDPPGTWTVTDLTAHDAVGNILDRTTGLGATVTVHDTADTTAPQITAVTPPSTTVDTSSGDVTVDVPVHASDDVSGVADGSLTFTSPDGTQTATGSFGAAPDSGTATDGAWDVAVDVPARGESGTWTLTAADVSDAQDNYAGYDIGDTPPPSAELHVTSAPDDTAPTFGSVDVGPAQVSTSNDPNGAATVVGHVTFTDDVSGLAEADIAFAGPDGTVDPSNTAVVTTDDGTAITSGTSTNGTVAFTTSLNAPAPGSWHVATVTLTDRAGNAQTFTPAVTAQTSFTVAAPGPDTAAPHLTSLQLSPSVADARQGAPQVTATVGVDDSGTTASGVAFADLTLESPSGDDVVFPLTNAPTSGDSVLGTLVDRESLGRFAEAGTWRVVSTSVTDAAGNETDYGPTTLAAALGHAVPTVVVAAAADTTAPTATSVSARAAAVDVSAGSPLSYDVAATDDAGGAGVLSAAVTLTGPGGRTLTGTGSLGTPSPSGTVPVDVAVPAYNAGGTWTVTSMSVTDGAHNTRTYTGDALTGLAGTHTVTVTGRVDTTPPGATAFTFTPSSVNTTSGAQDVAALVHLTDDASGVSDATLNVTGPHGQQVLTGALQLLAGTPADGWWQAVVHFPRYVDAGTWQAAVRVRDASGNSTTVDAAHLGAGATIAAAGLADTTAPTLAGITISPSSLTTDAADPRVTVSVSAADTASGVASVSATFSAPTGSLTLAPALTSANAGTAGTVTFTGSAALPAGAPTGTWTLSALTVRDTAGNTASFTATQLTAARWPDTFTVTAPGQASAPGAPTGVTASASSATSMLVSWTPPADTGGAVLTGYTVTGAPGGSCSTTSTACAIDGLTPGTSYTFTVTAANRAGTGAASTPSPAVVTPVGAPSAPRAVTATQTGPTAALVSWNAPASTGGAAVSGYVVTPVVDGVAGAATSVGTTTDATVTGLQRNVGYTFRVAARNAVGMGDASSTDAPLVLPATVASAPQAVGVTAGDGTATVRWSAPLDDGGAGVLRYTATSSGGQTCSTSGTSCTISGLRNGTAYTFRVVATNLVGDGGSGTSASVVPRGVTSLSTPRLTGPARYGSAERVTASLSTHGRPVAGQAVSLQYRASTSTGAWTTLPARARTATNGTLAVSFAPPYSVQVRLVFAAAGSYAATTSSAVRLSVQRAVSLRTSATRVRAGHKVGFTVTASPGAAGRVATLQRRSGSRWVTVAHHAMGSGAYTFRATSRTRGTTTYRAVLSSDARYATSYSAARAVRFV